MTRLHSVARTAISRLVAYLRRGFRGLALLQQVGRSGLFRLENRVAIAKLDYGRRDIYLGMVSRYAPARIRACAKEPWTVDWLERYLRPHDVLYDIGSNVGAYSLVAAAQGGGNVGVVAVEPAYATFGSLCDNIVLNGSGDSIIPLSVVLGSSTELGQLNYHDLEAGAGLHSTGDRPFLKGGFEPTYRQTVMTFRLDDLLSLFELPAPNHLKLDVDGAEADVLRGAPKTLESSSLRSVMVEVNTEQAEVVAALLAARGLEMRQRFEPPSTHGHWYGLFVRAQPGG